ncbi:type II CRISPR RNA-guided endonuclease Cas9 [Peptacetobacter hiranonis]|uniref:type II CRISPR RNA-guided endonuclease Cas9 n=1 Tax=Peptacetobacter hiranonis TaxID=89152 RepID=UPI002E77D621|nr:type II CRISPR RNA-guided endonuclease Cas9 [Peptacetobacter hiranonis]MEE0248562.1 type II CRISPR RNA-guided endonuclease Cas9 [Peptacetobacter hiranonis]
MSKEYFLGLDIGTSSLGWAVTDTNYKILRAKGKNLIGVRLFEEGKTAEERRLFRSSRRRTARRKERIKLLQELFAEEINKIDPTFFQRLKESKYYLEDKSDKDCPFALFNDEGFTDKEYHEKYPTIYHLRKDLIESDEKKDIRLIYLAIHNIIKNRGHFLLGEKNIDSVKSFKDAKDSFVEAFKEIGIEIEILNEDRFENTLKDSSLTKKDKLKNLNDDIAIKSEEKIDLKEKQNAVKELLKLITSQKCNLKNGFIRDELINDSNKPITLTFDSDNYEQDLEEIENLLSENEINFLEGMKKTYDWSILANILNGEAYLSDAKVATYEKHKKDLEDLKYVIKEYAPEEYKNMFSELDEKKANYVRYTGHYIVNKKKVYPGKKVTQEEFCKNVSSILKKIKHKDSIIDRIMDECEKLTFMPKQIDKRNGVLPYQLHQEELKKIIANAEKNYNFLNEKDSNGYVTKEKIEQLLTFRIPYYVGPLNDKHKESGFCWIEKKSNEKIYPWNFDDVVDKDKSAENFIMRMTNKCTYLVGEDVLPNQSILYSKFRVLNELNNLKINGEKPDVEVKKKIYNELFLTGNPVTTKKIKSFYKKEFGIDVEVSGIDGDFKNKMDSYSKIKSILVDVESNMEMAENIILWSTVLGSEKKMLRKKIETNYPELKEKQIKDLVAVNFTGWGRLSKKFLTGIKANIDGNNDISIIDAMEETNYNLMQLLSNQFEFIEHINKHNNDLNEDLDINNLDYDSLMDDLYASPAVKRSIWQTILVVKEIQEVMGCEPKRIFIETPRRHEEKNRTESRKDKLELCYKNCKEEEEKQLLKEIEGKEAGYFKSINLYLYYTQMGRCMYTGEKIELSQINNKKYYDRDHIYPRSKTKDDSIRNNLVLVKREANRKKSDNYPIEPSIQSKQNAFWNVLLKKGLISDEKYDRLTRKEELTSEELSNFIKRQIVFTGQSTKAVASIFGKIMKESEIVYTKAENISDFRKEIDFVKVRELNDLHHAHDAYLAIVVGNIYHLKFTKDVNKFVANGKEEYNLGKMYERDVERNGEKAWIADIKNKKGEVIKEGTKKTVKEMLSKGGILFTRYSFCRKGGLFNQNIVNKEECKKAIKKGELALPIKLKDYKEMNVEKYGGYKGVNRSFYSYIEYEDKKGNKIRAIRGIPFYVVENSKNDEECIKKYIEKNMKLKNPVILIPKIKINSLFEIDGYPLHLSGRTDNTRLIMKSAVQLKLDYKFYNYIKQILKYTAEKSENVDIEEQLKITKEKNLEIYEELYKKMEVGIYSKRPKLDKVKEFVKKGKDKFKELSIYNQSKQIKSILKVFNTTSDGIDLKNIGAKSDGTGKLLVNKVVTNYYKKVILINQSPTGLFERRIDLLQDTEKFFK